jgi:hypothetical protein
MDDLTPSLRIHDYLNIRVFGDTADVVGVRVGDDDEIGLFGDTPPGLRLEQSPIGTGEEMGTGCGIRTVARVEPDDTFGGVLDGCSQNGQGGSSGVSDADCPPGRVCGPCVVNLDRDVGLIVRKVGVATLRCGAGLRCVKHAAEAGSQTHLGLEAEFVPDPRGIEGLGVCENGDLVAGERRFRSGRKETCCHLQRSA